MYYYYYHVLLLTLTVYSTVHVVDYTLAMKTWWINPPTWRAKSFCAILGKENFTDTLCWEALCAGIIWKSCAEMALLCWNYLETLWWDGTSVLELFGNPVLRWHSVLELFGNPVMRWHLCVGIIWKPCDEMALLCWNYLETLWWDGTSVLELFGNPVLRWH